MIATEIEKEVNPFVEFLKQKNCENSEILKLNYICKDPTYIKKLSKEELEVVVYEMMYNLQKYFNEIRHSTLRRMSDIENEYNVLYDCFKESIDHLHIFHKENEKEIKFKHLPF